MNDTRFLSGKMNLSKRQRFEFALDVTKDLLKNCEDPNTFKAGAPLDQIREYTIGLLQLEARIERLLADPSWGLEPQLAPKS